MQTVWEKSLRQLRKRKISLIRVGDEAKELSMCVLMG